MKKKRSYQRVEKYNRPTIMMSMLNTHCSQIEANTRMAVTRTPEGRTFCLGKDFREVQAEQDERQYGVPRGLKL